MKSDRIVVRLDAREAIPSASETRKLSPSERLSTLRASSPMPLCPRRAGPCRAYCEGQGTIPVRG